MLNQQVLRMMQTVLSQMAVTSTQFGCNNVGKILLLSLYCFLKTFKFCVYCIDEVACTWANNTVQKVLTMYCTIVNYDCHTEIGC